MSDKQDGALSEERIAEAQALAQTHATVVAARKPSSASPTQPEATPEAEAEAPSLADAARSLITFVKAHRTAGDSDLEAAVADVESALASWGT